MPAGTGAVIPGLPSSSTHSLVCPHGGVEGTSSVVGGACREADPLVSETGLFERLWTRCRQEPSLSREEEAEIALVVLFQDLNPRLTLIHI